MSAWAWDELAQAAGGRWLVEPESASLDFAGVCIDTRELRPGQIFFAFVGEQADGHAYLAEARAKGASVCVVTHPDRVPEDLGIPVLAVDDVLDALTRLASDWRERIKAWVIAITGSNGKTTTCRLMHSVCGAAGKSFVSPKSFNNALGVPITILNTTVDAEYLVAEVGMSTPGEIAERTRLLRPSISIITSIGRAHLQALGSVENIAREKAQIITAAPEHAIGIIPAGIAVLDDAFRDDPHTLFSLGEVLRVELCDQHGCDFLLGGEPFRVSLPGEHNAHNAGLCVLAARAMGIDDSTIREGLANATPPPMRFERVQIETASGPIVVINDAYNANPDSMRAALSTFADLKTDGAKVVVLGEMLEMGASGPTEHQSLAEHVSGTGAFDRVVLIGAGYAGIDAAPLGLTMLPESSDAQIKAIAQLIEPGETVLIKGSRGVKLERLIAILGDLYASSRSQTHGDTPTHA